MIVPVQTITHVICDPDVMTRRIDLTSNDVSDPFFDAVHASLTGMEQASAKSERFLQIASLVRRVGDPESYVGLQGFQAGRGGPPTPLRGFGETAFAG
jgi:hypothetical protein